MQEATFNLKTEHEIAEEKKNKRTALLITIGVYTLLFLIILYIKMSPPDPPLPQAEGMEVILGEDLAGMNPVFEQPAPSASQPEQEEVKPQPVVTEPEPVKYETSNEQDAPVVKEVKKEPVKKEEPVKEEPKPRQVDKRTLFEKTPGTSNSESGTSTGKGTTYEPGNQGSKDGDKDAKSWEGQGEGNQGIGFDLRGRSAVALPPPINPTNDAGIVVVAIEVDVNGNVISARGGVRGSTTTNASLIAQAEKAARKAKFTTKADGTEIQSGTIRYNFKLQ